MSSNKRCVVLTSSMVSFPEQRGEIKQLQQMLDGNRVLYTEVDCSREENKAERDRYFAISGIRGNYPQVFLEDGNDVQYIGSFKQIQEYNELNDVPKELLEKNNLQTLRMVFKDVLKD